MKQCLSIFLFFLVLNQAIGQGSKPATSSFKDLPPCDCSVFLTGSFGYVPSQKAQQIVTTMLEKIRQNCRISFDDRILIHEANCPSPIALLCPTTLPNGRLKDERVILYSNKFLDDFNKTDAELTWTDQHVLAHEIGHHVFGHPVNEETIEALRKQFASEAGSKTGRLSKYQRFNLQAQEIQADFFGLWFLNRTEKNFDFNAFITNFDLINIGRKEAEIIEKEKKKGKGYTLTHPPFKERLDAMQNFWSKLQTDSRRPMVARLGYFANAASAAYINLNPEKPYYDIAFVAGLTVAGQPRFSNDGAPVSAILYNPKDALNAYLGLSLSRFKWQKPLRVEGEVAWSKQRYGTLLGSGNTQQLLETIELRYLSVFPKITWSPGGLGSDDGFSTSRVAFFASCGPMVRIPLGIDYQNHGAMVSPGNRPTAELSVSPRVSLGIELLRKTFLPRGYKLALSYELQHIRLNANPRPSTVSHNIDATLYYTFLRR